MFSDNFQSVCRILALQCDALLAFLILFHALDKVPQGHLVLDLAWQAAWLAYYGNIREQRWRNFRATHLTSFTLAFIPSVWVTSRIKDHETTVLVTYLSGKASFAPSNEMSSEFEMRGELKFNGRREVDQVTWFHIDRWVANPFISWKRGVYTKLINTDALHAQWNAMGGIIRNSTRDVNSQTHAGVDHDAITSWAFLSSAYAYISYWWIKLGTVKSAPTVLVKQRPPPRLSPKYALWISPPLLSHMNCTNY